MDNREIIDNFVELLNTKLEDSVKREVELDILNKYQKILIIGSASPVYLKEFIDEINYIQCKANLYILGQKNMEENIDLLKANYSGKIKFLCRSGQFSPTDIVNVENFWDIDEMQAVLFFNDFLNSVDYSNVEFTASYLKESADLYSCSIGTKTLSFYKNICTHYKSIILYKDLVEWFSSINN